MSKVVYAGLEISRDELIVAYSVDRKKPIINRFPNTPEGHARLASRFNKRDWQTRICLESTGVYGLDIAMVLDSTPGVEVMVANPRAVRRFGEALLQRQKTDMIDVLLLLEFAQRMKFKAWQRPSDEALALRATTRRGETMKNALVGEKNRRHALESTATTPARILEITNTLIEEIDTAIEELREYALELIQADELLRRRYEILTSICGIAEKSAIVILGELAVLDPSLDARQWVALAGLAPRVAQSGISLNKRLGIGKGGNKYLKKALFMPASCAVRFVPAFQDLRTRLLSRGLAKIQTIVAVMRKMLHLIHALFRDNRLFQREYTTPVEKRPLQNN